MIRGQVVNVFDEVLGSELTDAVAAGATTLPVLDLDDLDRQGGSLRIGDEVRAYAVSSTGVVQLTAPLTAAHAAGDRVDVEPQVIERIALIAIEDSDEAEAVVPHELVPYIPDGVRTEADEETVECRTIGGVFQVTRVIGLEPELDGEFLRARSIVAEKIATGTLTADVIAAGAITAEKLGVGSVIAGKIAADSITAAEIAANAITTSELAANSVIAGKIAANAVTADSIAANAITTDKIAANAITAGKIAADAITATQISADALAALWAEVGELSGGTLTGSVFQSAPPGSNPRVVVDSNGIRGTKPNGTDSLYYSTATGNLIVSGKVIAANDSTLPIAAATGSLTGAVAGGSLTVANLAGLSADLGSITAGTVTGATLQTAPSGSRVAMTPAGLKAWKAGSPDELLLDYNTTTGVLQMKGSILVGSTVPGSAVNSALATGVIPSLDASKIGTGTFTDGLIPSLDATKIATGTFVANRVPDVSNLNGLLTASKVGFQIGANNRLGNSGFDNPVNYAQGWSFHQSTGALETTLARDGGQAALVTAAGTAGMVPYVNQSQPERAKVTPGRPYTFSAYARSVAAASRSARIQPRWAKADGTLLNVANGDSVSWNFGTGPLTAIPTDGSWLRVVFTAIAPAEATHAGVGLEFGVGAVADAFVVDSFQFEEGEVATAWAPKPDEVLPGTITNAALTTGLDASKLTTGALPVAQVPSLPASRITSGTFGTGLIPNLDAAKINSGTFGTGLIPGLDAAKITSGIFATGFIPSLDAAKITTGSFADSRIPALDATKIATGTFVAGRVPDISNLNGLLTAAKVGFQTGGPNRLANSSFEGVGGLGSSAVISGATRVLSTAEARTGTQSLQVTTPGAVANEGVTVNNDLLTKVSPGDKPTYSIWAKGAGTVRIWVKHKDAGGADTANLNTMTGVTLTGSWQRLVFTPLSGAPTNTVATQLLVRTTSAEAVTLYLDDAQIEDGEIATAWGPKPDEILPGTVVNAMVGTDIDASKLGQGSLAVARITDGSLLDAKLGSGISGAKLSAGTVANAALGSGIDGVKLSSGTVANAALASGIDGSKLTDGTVADAKVASGLSATKLTTGTMPVARIPTLGITDTYIASDGITSPKIAANAVVAGKVAALAVEAGDIAALAVTANEIAALTITAGKIAANAIEADKIAANAITAGKIAADAIDGKTITGATIQTASGVTAKVLINTSGLSTTSNGLTTDLTLSGADGLSLLAGTSGDPADRQRVSFKTATGSVTAALFSYATGGGGSDLARTAVLHAIGTGASQSGQAILRGVGAGDESRITTFGSAVAGNGAIDLYSNGFSSRLLDGAGQSAFMRTPTVRSHRMEYGSDSVANNASNTVTTNAITHNLGNASAKIFIEHTGGTGAVGHRVHNKTANTFQVTFWHRDAGTNIGQAVDFDWWAVG